MASDPHGDAHLERVRARLDDCGVVNFFHGAVREVWRANIDRYEPDELYDDAVTLGLLSARNLSNRARAEVREDQDLALKGVHVTLDRNATVVHAGGVDLRMVKAPLRSGRHPRFDSDFRWTDTDGRLAAARRNFEAYQPHSELVLPLFETECEDPSAAVAWCRDVFLVWSGELESGLTAGWLGLPTLDPQSFLAVTRVWWDEHPLAGRPASEPGKPSDGVTFGEQPVPTPVVALKPRRKEENTL